MGIKASSVRSLSQLGGARRMVQVGQRCGNYGIITLASAPNGGNYFTSHQRMVFPYGADSLQFVFPNFYAAQNHVGETNLPPSMFAATGVTYSGGSGYAVGDVDTFALTNTTGIAPLKVMITAVSSGAPTQVQVVDGGLYNTPLAAGASPSSTTGSGTGATATFTWKAGCMGLHIGIEPTWNTLVTGGGAGQVEKVSLGMVAQNQSGNLACAFNSSLLAPLDNLLVSDILAVDVPVGSAIGIRISMGYGTPYLSRPAISSANAPSAPSASYEAAFAASTFTDYSVSGTIGTSVSSLYMLQPLLVLGLPKVQGITVMARADSRASGESSGLGVIFGNYDLLDKDGNIGWFEKACSLTTGIYCPYSNMSGPSNSINPLVTSPYYNRVGFLKAVQLAQPTAVYVGLNFNDLGQGYGLASVLAYEQQLINELRGLGVKYVFTDTTDPWTNSTDNYATVGNQTYANTSVTTNQIGRNTQLTSGTWATYDFFIDQRPNVESSVNSGYWRTNGTANYYTGDGTHASPQAVTLKAATAATAMAANISL